MTHPSLRIGSLILDGRLPLVAASFDARVTSEGLQEAKRAGLDLAELRVDLFESLEPATVLERVSGLSGLPLLLTIRHVSEGGRWSAPEPQRAALFGALMGAVDAIDIELGAHAIRDSVIAQARAASRTVVVSFHDFAATPDLDSLRGVVRAARAAGADIVKIAAMVHGDHDVRTLSRLLLESTEVPMVIIGMGAHGVKSRVFFPALGSLFTFAALERTTAPGQLPLPDLMAELRRFYPVLSEKV